MTGKGISMLSYVYRGMSREIASFIFHCHFLSPTFEKFGPPDKSSRSLHFKRYHKGFPPQYVNITELRQARPQYRRVALTMCSRIYDIVLGKVLALNRAVAT